MTVVSSGWAEEDEKAGVKVKLVVVTVGAGLDWKASPDRAVASITVPTVSACPPMVREPAPGSGREARVMWDSTASVPDSTAKSWGEKAMVSPTRPFLVKSATAGTSSFLSQKKAEADRGRAQTSKRVSTAASPRRKRGNCFKGMTSLLNGCAPSICLDGEMIQEKKGTVSGGQIGRKRGGFPTALVLVSGDGS